VRRFAPSRNFQGARARARRARLLGLDAENIVQTALARRIMFGAAPKVVSLPASWTAPDSRINHFAWPPGAHVAARAGGTPAVELKGGSCLSTPRAASASSASAAPAFVIDKSVQPYGGADASIAARVMALATPPPTASSPVEYLQQHQIEAQLHKALNTMIKHELPDNPWEVLLRLLPDDVRVPPALTVPIGAKPEALGLEQLKHEWLTLHTWAGR
tara:strand:+ start:966 stop:1616 length:651 start_codon:yes stop_codon:yes gene_type:complete